MENSQLAIRNIDIESAEPRFIPPTHGISLKGSTSVDMSKKIKKRRSCTVEITNLLSEPLKNPEHLCDSGYCYFPMQLDIAPHTVEAFAFAKTTGSLTGTSGVFTYRIGNSDLKLAVMFSIPLVLNKNWYALAIIPTSTQLNTAIFQKMYASEEWTGLTNKMRASASDGITLKIHHEHFSARATISGARNAILKITISTALRPTASGE